MHSQNSYWRERTSSTNKNWGCILYLINQYTYEIGEQNYFGRQKIQTNIAQDLNITTQQLRNYKKLLTLIPELQDWLRDEV
ncbi:hypothetical protein [Paenibacillus polymyxa]|uniref:hypothetical protein n=1 Tax=Paenibacillus polymyxa TaxID=1406 RepID=UPI0001E317B0|nr:hypothetical protein [Paenibacillus polymyxa]